MTLNYTPDAISLQFEPMLAGMNFSPGSHQPAHDSAAGRAIYDLFTSRAGVAMLVGAVVAAPSRPPVVAPEPLLERIVGEAAFTDDMKKYAGRLTRYIIEHLGGRWVRRGVKVTVASSKFGSGSIYTFNITG